jgi:hypothetical protein
MSRAAGAMAIVLVFVTLGCILLGFGREGCCFFFPFVGIEIFVVELR